MKKWAVTFVVYQEGHQPTMKKIIVEAGNKKLATTRGMLEINKIPDYKDRFKTLFSVEEVA